VVEARKRLAHDGAPNQLVLVTVVAVREERILTGRERPDGVLQNLRHGFQYTIWKFLFQVF
jgi:hypothetical protein